MRQVPTRLLAKPCCWFAACSFLPHPNRLACCCAEGCMRFLQRIDPAERPDCEGVACALESLSQLREVPEERGAPARQGSPLACPPGTFACLLTTAHGPPLHPSTSRRAGDGRRAAPHQGLCRAARHGDPGVEALLSSWASCRLRCEGWDPRLQAAAGNALARSCCQHTPDLAALAVAPARCCGATGNG